MLLKGTSNQFAWSFGQQKMIDAQKKIIRWCVLMSRCLLNIRSNQINYLSVDQRIRAYWIFRRALIFFRTKSTSFWTICCHERKVWVVVESIVVLLTVALAFPIFTLMFFLYVLTFGAGILTTNGHARICHSSNITCSFITKTFRITEFSIKTSHFKLPFTSDFTKKMLNITKSSYKRKK